MKKLLIPTLLALFAAGMSEAKAGVSFEISIGGGHRHFPPPPPVIVHRPPPVVVHRPPVVVVPPRYDRYDECDRKHVHVRECSHYEPRHRHHDHRRDKRDRHDRWHR